MNECANSCVGIVELFQGETLCAALCVAGIAFAAGILLTCLVCRLRCKTKASGASKATPSKKQRKPATKDGFVKHHTPPADGSIEIYVGNLSYDLTEDRLRKEFEAFGKVNSARIITNRYNGKSKGFGFVHMPNRAEADAALKGMSDKELLGRNLKCNEAKNVD